MSAPKPITIMPVCTAAEHAAATARLQALTEAADVDSDAEADADRNAAVIQAQASLIETYERTHFPIPAPDALTAIRFRMEQEGLDRADLAKILHVERGRVSELLNGKRQFTVTMLRSLHDNWRIPAEALIASVKRRRSRSLRTA